MRKVPPTFTLQLVIQLIISSRSILSMLFLHQLIWPHNVSSLDCKWGGLHWLIKIHDLTLYSWDKLYFIAIYIFFYSLPDLIYQYFVRILHVCSKDIFCMFRSFILSLCSNFLFCVVLSLADFGMSNVNLIKRVGKYSLLFYFLESLCDAVFCL